MAEVTTREIIAMVRAVNPPLASLVKRMADGKDADLAWLRNRMLDLADSWEQRVRDADQPADQATATCVREIREVIEASPETG